MGANEKSIVLLTGFPGFVSKRLAIGLADHYRDASFRLVVEQKKISEAEKALATLPRPGRFEILTGDVTAMHLGLSGAEYARLRGEITNIWHLAGTDRLIISHQEAQHRNVEGTRNLLELAKNCQKLKRLAYFSSVFVSGARTGVVFEDELKANQKFRAAYEESKYMAEAMVTRELGNLPITVFRPSIVIGDSQTGQIDQFDNQFYLSLLSATNLTVAPILSSSASGGTAPMHVVPVDYVVEAAIALAEEPRAIGKTFHLVDPSPVSSRRIWEMASDLLRRRMPNTSVTARAAGALFRMPILDRFLKQDRTALDYLNHLVFYNCEQASGLLEPKAIKCPPLTSYLPRIVGFVNRQQQKSREESSHFEDQLDSSSDLSKDAPDIC